MGGLSQEQLRRGLGMGSAAVAVSLTRHPGLWAEWGPAGLGEVRAPGCAYPVSTSGGVGGPGDISGAGGKSVPGLPPRTFLVKWVLAARWEGSVAPAGSWEGHGGPALCACWACWDAWPSTLGAGHCQLRLPSSPCSAHWGCAYGLQG